MAYRAAAINGRQWNPSFHSRCCFDILPPASGCRNWACLVLALCSALLLLHCSGAIRSGVRTWPRVQGSANSGSPLAHMGGCDLIRRCSRLLSLHSELGRWSDATLATSEIGVTSPLRSKPSCCPALARVVPTRPSGVVLASASND